MTERDQERPGERPETQIGELLEAESYWVARAMKEQGSRFFRALGEALDAADARNRRRIYETWPEDCQEFYRRGRRLEAAESASGSPEEG